MASIVFRFEVEMSTPFKISRNERLILDIVRRHEPILRSAIPAHSPFTQPSVFRIVNNLSEKRLLKVGKAEANGPGKPSPQILLDRSRYLSLGISVHTDTITICLANLAAEQVSESTITGRSRGRSYALDAIRTEVDKMLADEGARDEDLLGVCLGVPGYFLSGQVQLNAPEPLEDWSLVDLHAALRNYFGQIPTYVENNATTGAIGESLLGVGKWADTFAYLSIDYGFGGGVIIDGKPYTGANGNALEIGAMFTHDERSHRPALQFLIEILNSNGVAVSTVADLCEGFDPDWPGVDSWIDQSIPLLNRALWAISCVLDPEVIVFGGEIPQQLAEMLIERVTLHADPQGRYDQPLPTPQLRFTEAPRFGAALGAALLPLKARVFL